MKMNDKRHLHLDPCPNCGLEPEVRAYYKRGTEYVGYHDHCGAIVIAGSIQGFDFT